MSEPYYVTAVEAELASRRRTALQIGAVIAAVIVAAVVGYYALF